MVPLRGTVMDRQATLYLHVMLRDLQSVVLPV